jgi:nucleotide-binding universal stress UspA family protein
MDYKTILVHVDKEPAAEARIRLAIGLARGCGAHLVGSAVTGVSHFVTAGMLAAADDRLAARCAALRRDAAAALLRFEEMVRQAGLASWEGRLVDDDVDGGMAVQARYCDLVLVGQAAPATHAPDQRADLPDYLLLASGRPVLVVPNAAGPWRLDGEALVAWDGSAEATRAVTGALPLLRAARRTTVVGFGNAAAEASDGDPCVRLATWLGRHGIAARTSHRAAAGDVGEALLSAAADMDADLLVMGGYGHARYRELVLGGVTATILGALTLPVLLAH